MTEMLNGGVEKFRETLGLMLDDLAGGVGKW